MVRNKGTTAIKHSVCVLVKPGKTADPLRLTKSCEQHLLAPGQGADPHRGGGELDHQEPGIRNIIYSILWKNTEYLGKFN